MADLSKQYRPAYYLLNFMRFVLYTYVNGIFARIKLFTLYRNFDNTTKPSLCVKLLRWCIRTV